MGTRGPRGKLQALEALEGYPSRKAVLEDSGIIGFGEPELVTELCKAAEDCFHTIKLSMPPQIYAKMDSYLISAYAMTWAIMTRAHQEINSADFAWIVYSAKGVPSESPWLKMHARMA